ncbi:MAG: WecB/TagA/CpsF family glycosyltransferase [Pseudonocardia sp.]
MMIDREVAEIDLLGARLSLVAGDELVRNVVDEASRAGSGYVCVANVHQVTEAWRSESFRQTLQDARWVSTDSRVLEVALGALGHPYSSDVTYGAEIFEDICAAASEAGMKVGLFGGAPRVVAELARILTAKYEPLQLCFVNSPDFGTAAELASDATVELVNASGVQILLVGLGCPKQERWMQLVSSRVHCMMVGVGAAFDFYAGEKRSAPAWVRRAGLDWLWRLASEPRRLWRRYLIGNSLFLARVVPVIVARRLRPLFRS